MQTQEYKQCARCVMDTSDPDIAFDHEGNCNHCSEFLNVRARYKYRGIETDQARERVIGKIKQAGKNRRYDCVIGVSGGADSSYVAYIVKEFGLRPLAVHLDNGWDSEESVRNIRTVVSALAIDYESYVLDWEEFKDIQLAFLRASVPEAETPTDLAIAVALHHYAAKYNVRYIISGGNLVSEGILPKSWHYNSKDLTYFRHIQKEFGTRPIRKYKTFGYVAEMYCKLIRQIRMVYLLNYLPFDKNEATELLTEKLSWQKYGQKHFESIYTRFIQSYYLYEKFGIDYRRATLSSEICSGQAIREEAVEILKSMPYEPAKVEEEKQYISKKLGVAAEGLEKIIRLDPKWYWEYPNDDRKLTFIYNTYRTLFNAERLSSS
jgi:N-acetyl sugar amidotransferase